MEGKRISYHESVRRVYNSDLALSDISKIRFLAPTKKKEWPALIGDNIAILLHYFHIDE